MNAKFTVALSYPFDLVWSGSFGRVLQTQVSSSLLDHGTNLRDLAYSPGAGITFLGRYRIIGDTICRNYTRTFGDGPRNFEPWSSNLMTPELEPPLLTTTPHQREDVSALDRFNVNRCPTRRVFSGTGLELVTRQATIRYLYHSATAARAAKPNRQYKGFFTSRIIIQHDRS
ncbi:uncharacterized protein TNCV_2021801 [Trichonephila clavipes]|nr:uncharacterized protein TNCV_2021801 [Trichonephila clavipes]